MENKNFINTSDKKNNLKLVIIYILIFFVGFFFSQVHLFEQRAVDAGLVLANLVSYPDEISPMKEYFIKSWTSLHQISKIFLNFNWSLNEISKLIIFMSAILYFVGIFLITKSTIRSFLIPSLIAVVMLIFQKNFGDTDYPSLVFSEHTYGMVSLAMITCICGLLFSGNLFYTGLLSSLLICVHPLIGIWASAILAICIFMNKYYFKFNLDIKNLTKGYILGILFTVISLIYYLVAAAEIISYFDLESYNNYMKFWEGHRNESEIHTEYLLKTLVLFIFGLLSLTIFNNSFSENFRFGILFVLTSITISTILYFLYKLFLPVVPDFFTRFMPSRFTILHSVIGWPIILAILFVVGQKVKFKSFIPSNFGYILVIFLIFYYTVSHYKTVIKINNLFINNTFDQVKLYEENEFWDSVNKIKFDGYILTSFSSSTISMRKTFKPIILDVSSLDFVPYFPNTAKSMSLIIEEIYGINFAKPPKEIKNKPFLSDEIIKNNFEIYSKDNWEMLSKKFNFRAIIIPKDWNINISPEVTGKRFALYII